METFAAGGISAIAMIFLMLKMDILKVCGYDLFFDVSFTALLATLFSGTYTGMLAAIIAGAIISIYLFIVKRIKGYKRLVYVDGRLTWVHYYIEKREMKTIN